MLDSTNRFRGRHASDLVPLLASLALSLTLVSPADAVSVGAASGWSLRVEVPETSMQAVPVWAKLVLKNTSDDTAGLDIWPSGHRQRYVRLGGLGAHLYNGRGRSIIPRTRMDYDRFPDRAPSFYLPPGESLFSFVNLSSTYGDLRGGRQGQLAAGSYTVKGWANFRVMVDGKWRPIVLYTEPVPLEVVSPPPELAEARGMLVQSVKQIDENLSASCAQGRQLAVERLAAVASRYPNTPYANAAVGYLIWATHTDLVVHHTISSEEFARRMAGYLLLIPDGFETASLADFISHRCDEKGVLQSFLSGLAAAPVGSRLGQEIAAIRAYRAKDGAGREKEEQ